MEDNTPPSATAAPPADRTAAALRELHERARQALDTQRSRIGQLEVQLTEQLDSIAEALAEQTSGDEAEHARQSHEVAEQVRRELAQAQAAWEAERAELAEDGTSRARLLDERHTELDARAAQLASSRSELDARQQALDERAAQLNAQERELRHRHEELETYAQQCAAQQSQLTAAEGELARQREELAARETVIESSQQESAQDRGEHSARELAWQEERADLESQRDALKEQTASLSEEVALLSRQASDQLADFQRQLAEQQDAWSEQRITLENERLVVEMKRDELAAALADTSAELDVARTENDPSVAQDELQRKFDLALEDVQRLRGRVAGLEQELSTRPELDQSDSVELVHLRAERDALAQRITELEHQQPSAPVDSDTAQEMAELQSRFEIAVEDVRELKKKNSLLESQLAEMKSRPGAATPAAAVDTSWESLKRQMLASLENEGDAADADRQEERVQIESTIRITDEVVANKDREIAELKNQLAVGEALSETDAVHELVDADEIIRQHRERYASLEREMEDKLRAAELEMSVERAKIAREQSQLADLRSELDSLRALGDNGGAASSQHVPKRRWLSKLGLSGEDE